MTFSGNDAIDFLAREARQDDPGASSHWREQHAHFQFSGDGFQGLAGFGGALPRNWTRQVAHRLFQVPLRSMGRRFAAFSEIDRLAGRICATQDRTYDLDVLRNALTVMFMKQLVPERMTAGATACVIGDGFATLATLLLGSGSAGRVFLVNLTKTLLVDMWYLRLWLGPDAFERDVVVTTDASAVRTITSRPAGDGVRVVAVQAAHHELLRLGTFDTVFNIASMGEMDPPATAAYFADLRAAAALSPRGLAFYCCNREEKRLPDGTTTRFADYPWRDVDIVLEDALCPWHQRYYAFRPPFYFPYDGPIRHRLALLAPAQNS